MVTEPLVEKNTKENKRKRLIALVPDWDLDEVQFARRVRSIATRNNLEVVFLSMVDSIDDEPAARRCLITLGAITRDALTPVQTKIYFGKNWIKAIKSIRQPGDFILCHAEQTIARNPFSSESLCAHLKKAFSAPILTVIGFYVQPKRPAGLHLPRFVHWIILVGIFVVFFGIEVNIDKSTHGWPHTALGVTAVVIEIFLIWIWSTVTG
jgi:hypothetical protein